MPLLLGAPGVQSHQAEVRVHEPLLRLEVAALDALRQLHLLFPRQQAVAPHLPEEELERVGGGLGQLAVAVAAALRLVPAAVVTHLYPARLQTPIELLDLRLVEVQRLDRLGELGQLDASIGRSSLEERRNLRLIQHRRGGHDLTTDLRLSRTRRPGATNRSGCRAQPPVTGSPARAGT